MVHLAEKNPLLRKCIKIVLSFALTYGVMVFAFSLSIYTVIRNSRIRVENNTAANETILCTLNGTECYKECTVDDDGGGFTTYRKAIKVVVWMLFQPGDYTVVDCSEGLSRVVSQLIWFLYNLVASVTLMNLLIALMGAGMREVLHLGNIFDKGLTENGQHLGFLSNIVHSLPDHPLLRSTLIFSKAEMLQGSDYGAKFLLL